MNPTLADLGTPPPDPSAADWNDDGVVLLSRFFADHPALDAYIAEWRTAHGYTGFGIEDGIPILHADRPAGWPESCPYMTNPALHRLVCDPALGDVLAELIGEPAAVNLNLTGWVSTERDWHADSYLNEPEVGDHYAAVWIACGDIHPKSGVFQYVPGSHRWPQITRETISRYYDITDPQWPKQSEELLTPLFENELVARGAPVESYVPEKGDVLIWHGRTLHRGSRPAIRGAYRPALIAHYSGIHHRPRMPAAVQHDAGGWYFPIEGQTW